MTLSGRSSHLISMFAFQTYEYFTGDLIRSKPDPGRKKSYSDQDLQLYTKTHGIKKQEYIPVFYAISRLMAYKKQEYIPVFVCHKSWYRVVSLGRCSFFPSRVGLRTYQHSCTYIFLVNEARFVVGAVHQLSPHLLQTRCSFRRTINICGTLNFNRNLSSKV